MSEADEFIRQTPVNDIESRLERIERLVTEMHSMMITVKLGIEDASKSGGMLGMLAKSFIPPQANPAPIRGSYPAPMSPGDAARMNARRQ